MVVRRGRLPTRCKENERATVGLMAGGRSKEPAGRTAAEPKLQLVQMRKPCFCREVGRVWVRDADSWEALILFALIQAERVSYRLARVHDERSGCLCCLMSLKVPLHNYSWWLESGNSPAWGGGMSRGGADGGGEKSDRMFVSASPPSCTDKNSKATQIAFSSFLHSSHTSPLALPPAAIR